MKTNLMVFALCFEDNIFRKGIYMQATGILVYQKECTNCREQFIGTLEDKECPICLGSFLAYVVSYKEYVYGVAGRLIEKVCYSTEELEKLMAYIKEEGHQLISVTEAYYI